MINEKVKKILEEHTWFIATCGDEPNVVPVGFKAVLEDGRLAVGDVFMKYTCANVKANGKIAIAACDPATAEGYQIKGKAEYVTEGPVFDIFAKMAQETFKGAVNAKGALVITPEKVIVATPGPDNNTTF